MHPKHEHANGAIPSAMFHGLERNATLQSSTHRVLAGKTGHIVSEASIRVGVCVNMLINMLHEGLTCLALLHSGMLINLRSDAFLVAILIFLNGTREVFDTLVTGVLQREEICQSYVVKEDAVPETLR